LARHPQKDKILPIVYRLARGKPREAVYLIFDLRFTIADWQSAILNNVVPERIGYYE
jgi:hypothetical protein